MSRIKFHQGKASQLVSIEVVISLVMMIKMSYQTANNLTEASNTRRKSNLTLKSR